MSSSKIRFPEGPFLYVREFAEDFFPGGFFECFCDIFWSVGSCINSDVYMVLVESNLPENPSMCFADLSEQFFTTSLDIRKVKDVVTVFGFEAEMEDISSNTSAMVPNFGRVYTIKIHNNFFLLVVLSCCSSGST
jgi:hypothetical protein